MSRYRFALRPRWILSHLLVLTLIGAMISAGFWQLNRRDEKRDRNAAVAARAELPPVDVTGLAAPGDFDDVSELEYRKVSATGEYLQGEEVLVRSRSRNGAPGSWVMTPLVLDDGTAVVVNRGWISNSGALEEVPEASLAPQGPVAVSGLVRITETRGRFGADDPDQGQLTDMARADVERIGQQIEPEVLPFYVQLLEQSPAPGGPEQPEPVPAPAQEEGPHLSYAVQWFIFTTVAVVGYPLILRRRAREVEVEERTVDRHDGGAPEPVDAASRT